MNIRDRQAALAIDVGLAVVFVAGLVVTAGAIRATWGGGYWQLDCAAGAVVSALALCRRRHRAATAVTGLAVAAVAIAVSARAGFPQEPGPVTALALAVLVGSAIRTLPVRSAAAVTAGGFAVVLGCWLADQPFSPAPSTVTVLNAMAWLAACAGGAALRLLDGRRRSTAEQIRRDERLELARELHDVVAHHITGIVLQAQAARLLARKDPGRLAEPLAGIEQAGADALAAMRRVVGLLRDSEDAAPASREPSHGAEQLSTLVQRFNEHGPTARLRLPDDTGWWPPEVASTVYRIVQEALTNISQHAPGARSVTVAVDQDPAVLTVEVSDDAPPTRGRPALRSGYGLAGMRERVQALGGTLTVGPRPGAGWSVVATLPAADRSPR
ncbi:signal transduction histidine kinase [Allocatelliglobosispora scoriae]|uniref:histidine kinase n=1 Tax=Allocatelliglobosispora scoriae TaxID=643052 RepID=A0A841C3N7_9ACTN|nr:sensor histidine kinase [Allocatelliglobosispora scoriae]MBB5873672.1 signal transduction histidine kinase [Allocatelliglobosispora scoriae]